MDGRRCRRRLVALAVSGLLTLLLVVLISAAGAQAATLTLTLDTPANGSYTNSQTPTFSGVASSDQIDQVSIAVYSGTSTTGTPVQTLTAAPDPTTGAYSVTPGTPLGDGTYTAQATQSDLIGDSGQSTANTFTIDTTPPAVTLTDPVNASVTNQPKPTFDGNAGTAPGDGSTIAVSIYSGNAPTGTPVQTLTATASGSSWSVTPTTALADGTYTAQASQSDQAGNTGTSNANTFTIDTTPPAVTLTAPANGSATSSTKPTFGGSAGNAAGDLPTITINVYAGDSTSGTLADSFTTQASGSSYSAASPAALSPGTYTAQAWQSDDAGNTGYSNANTFTVQAAPSASTQAASSVSYNAADLNGIVSPNGADTTVHFEYGTTTSYGTPTANQDIGSGFSATLVRASLTNLSPATMYHFRIVATNAVGTTYGSDRTFTTAPTPGPLLASFTTSPGTTFSVGTPVQFTSTSTDPNASIVSYDWSWGDGTPDGNGPSPTHTYTKVGSYTVTLTVTNNYGNTDSSSENVSASGSPVSVAFTPPSAAPTGTSLNFSAAVNDPNQGAAITGYDWNWGDGTPDGTGSTPSHSFATAGIYTVTLTVTDSAGETGSVTHDVIVDDRPPTAAFAPGSGNFVIGNPVPFDASPSSDPDGSITGYSWNFGDGSTASGESPSHTYSQPGTFTVTLSITDNSGNTGSVSHQITLSAPPPIQTLIENVVPAPETLRTGAPWLMGARRVDLGRRVFCADSGPVCQTTITATSSSLAQAAQAAGKRKMKTNASAAAGHAVLSTRPNGSSELRFTLIPRALSWLHKHRRLPLHVRIVSVRGGEVTTISLTFVLKPR